MTELIGWIIVVGIVVAIGGIYILSRKIEQHTRDTAEALMYSNEMMLDQLKRITDPSASTSASEPAPTLSVTLERRCAARRGSANVTYMADKRRSPGRRKDDLQQSSQAG
jgi:hypothetical protein